MKRLIILVAVIVGFILLMSNGAIFLLPGECEGEVGILPENCIPGEYR